MQLNAHLIQKPSTILSMGITFLCSLPNLSIDAQQSSPPITAQTLEEQAQRLFEARKSIAKEGASWSEQKPLFEDLIALREREIAGIDEFTETAQSRIQEVTEKRAKLEKEEADSKAWRSTLEQEVLKLEASLKETIPLLPPPVKVKVGPSISRFEDEGSSDRIPLQERFRDVLSILSAARDFNSKLTIDREVREVDGKRFQIDVLYLGLDHAWYVDESGKMAGFGVPTLEGWIWTEDKSIASKVRTAIEVNRREIPPAVVSLPFAAKTDSVPATE
ncbi:MAG: DUF3450 family protein [Verrucomicrobiota bacterium]